MAEDGDSDWVRLNVGGTMYETTRTTLANLKSQFLDRLLAEDSGFSRPADGVYKIDRDPEVFRVLLNFGRHGQLLLNSHVTADMLEADADFYILGQHVRSAIDALSEDPGADNARKYFEAKKAMRKRNHLHTTPSVKN
ncbi:BTB/POZ domain-containing protein KCTD17-like [Branchiostoma lanceolatum]|uniref:BTB/POZ domain-containing protein KCTD17-like n=1 Tax=Branchiostoma lanceolatum TaxID=7740 RepID=UPI003455F404